MGKQSLIQIIYVSQANADLTTVAFEELLAHARAKNAELGITGILLYDDQKFIQVIEGEREVVEALYASLLADSRHKNLVQLLNIPITQRTFPSWSMAVPASLLKLTDRTSNDLYDSSTCSLSVMKYLIDQLKADRATQTLREFLDSGWRAAIA